MQGEQPQKSLLELGVAKFMDENLIRTGLNFSHPGEQEIGIVKNAVELAGRPDRTHVWSKARFHMRLLTGIARWHIGLGQICDMVQREFPEKRFPEVAFAVCCYFVDNYFHLLQKED